ncbi:MAG: hypothetical protein ABSB26_04825 [Nitrososphaerales archaeon]|jgi:hypothetical protein
MSVRVSPISRFVSLLIIAIGVFTLLGGFATGILEDSIAGIAIIILGIILHGLLYRFGRKVQRPVRDRPQSRESNPARLLDGEKGKSAAGATPRTSSTSLAIVRL